MSQYFAAGILNWRLWQANACTGEETGQKKTAAADPEREPNRLATREEIVVKQASSRR